MRLFHCIWKAVLGRRLASPICTFHLGISLGSRSREQQPRPLKGPGALLSSLPAFKRPIGRPEVPKGRGEVPQQPSNELGGRLRRKFSPSAVPEPPLTDGRAKTTYDGRLIRAALFAALRGQPTRARCRPALHTKGPEGARQLDSVALNSLTNTKKTHSSSTGDHHAEHNTRRRTVHHRKHRGSN